MNKALRSLLTESFDPDDKWGWVMGWRFDIAETLFRLREEIPADWEFRPGASLITMMNPLEHLEWGASELLYGLNWGYWTADDLRYAGTVLGRYAAWVRAAGEDY